MRMRNGTKAGQGLMTAGRRISYTGSRKYTNIQEKGEHYVGAIIAGARPLQIVRTPQGASGSEFLGATGDACRHCRREWGGQINPAAHSGRRTPTRSRRRTAARSNGLLPAESHLERDADRQSAPGLLSCRL